MNGLPTFVLARQLADIPARAVPLWSLASKLADLSIEDVSERGGEVLLPPHDAIYYECEVGTEWDEEELDVQIEREAELLREQENTLDEPSRAELGLYRQYEKDQVDQANAALQTIEGRQVPEEELVAFELPQLPFTGTLGRIQGLHYSIACRTIITAARGGKLKALKLKGSSIQDPFALPQLVPFWVGIQDWGPGQPVGQGYTKWLGAAAELRRALSHAYIQHAKGRRQLTTADIQALESYLTVISPPRNSPLTKQERIPFALYIPWLEDEDLAEQVADAWKAVVARGEADVVKCVCLTCCTHQDID